MLGNGDASYFSIIESTTRGGCLFEPAIDSIPADSLYSSDCRFVQALDAESGNLIESCASVLDSMVGRAGIGAECLTASAATISTALSPVSLVEAVADDVSNPGYSRVRASLVWTAETFHCFWTLLRVELMVWN
jgi:hypothetical protein